MKNISALSPLPFYQGTDLRYQHHRKSYAFGNVFPLISYRDMLLPFQISIYKPHEPVIRGDLEFGLFHFDGTLIGDITSPIKNKGLDVIEYEDIYVIKYPAISALGLNISEGRYFLRMTTKEGEYYSEVFTVCNSIDKYLCLEYKNSQALQKKDEVVDFFNNFTFRVYLCTQVGKPEYLFEESAIDRMGYTFIESQVSKKIHKFTFVAPEYLCDALRLVKLCDYKKITSNGLEYYPMTFDMNVNWEEQGDLASVECSFETDTVIVNIGGAK